MWENVPKEIRPARRDRPDRSFPSIPGKTASERRQDYPSSYSMWRPVCQIKMESGRWGPCRGWGRRGLSQALGRVFGRAGPMDNTRRQGRRTVLGATRLVTVHRPETQRQVPRPSSCRGLPRNLRAGNALRIEQPYNPRSALINTILILPFGNDFSVIVHVLQIREGLLHSSQNEVLTQGVFISSRMALTGAA